MSEPLPGQGEIVCRVDEVAEGSARGFTFRAGDRVRKIVVARKNGRFFCYRNVCPHAGTPLDWVPDKLLDHSRAFLYCQTHGALFEIETGFCVDGPCAGDSLTALRIEVKDDKIRLLD